MSVPIGAGMFLTRHVELLAETFHIGAGFLSDEDRNTLDPSMRSARWSRGFAGLKILLSLGVAGWGGYESVWRCQIALGERLRTGLRARGWRILNDTPLPVVCFTDDTTGAPEADRGVLTSLAQVVNDSGHARIFRVDIGGLPALRAAVTNYGSGPGDIDRLVDLLDRARSTVRAARDRGLTVPDADSGLSEAQCVTRQSAESTAF
jgi:glutamate/tyrosine decarboxylase-like PLP-dependent enzyme